MRYNHLLVAALCAVASPAMAQDSGVYAALEGGASFPQSKGYDVAATRVQTVPTGRGLLGQAVTTTNTLYRNGFNSDNKIGFDVDAIAGYDFGFVRIEGEIGYKRNGVRNLAASSFLLTDTNTAPISGVTSSSFMSRNRISVLSGMADALANYNLTPAVHIYAGGGVGRARVEALGSRNSVWAYQAIVGASTSIASNLELGLKYRYFQTDRLRFDSGASFADSATGTTSISQFSDSGKFRSNSVLVSLIYNFGRNTRER